MPPIPTRTPPSADPRSDSQLVRASLDAPELFEQLFVRHVRAIFAFAAARVGTDAAEDVTAEVFSIAFEQRSRFDEAASSARPWLYGICVNKLRHHRQAEQRWLDLGHRMPIDLPGGPDETETVDRMDARRRLPVLLRALHELSPAERDVLVLHVLAGLTHAQIAGALGIRENAAKVRLSRGRARLRTAMQAEEGDRDE